MICGIGTDIAKVSRFKKWIDNPEMINHFFNEKEVKDSACESALCQHYAARFAAKEAFSKALGTGVSGFSLNEVSVLRNDLGAPYLKLSGNAEKTAEGYEFSVSITHTDELAQAVVIAFRKGD